MSLTLRINWIFMELKYLSLFYEVEFSEMLRRKNALEHLPCSQLPPHLLELL